MTAEPLINALRQSTLLAEMPPALVEAIASGVERVELDGAMYYSAKAIPATRSFSCSADG